MILRAPAKLNLCLYLGQRLAHGLHQLVSVFCPLTLADRIIVEPAEADEVVCPGVEGQNLAAAALAALRDRGWAQPPTRIEIEKRIPVAAGLGGGSADAAAVLRLARGQVEGLEEIAAGLGSDVPSQLDPRPTLVTGTGERVEPLPSLGALGVVGITAAEGLSTADVYAEADRLGLCRPAWELDQWEERIRAAVEVGEFPLGDPVLPLNDLEPAALTLRPEIGDALEAVREAGAKVYMVAGSGPTVVGLFEDIAAADRAAAELPPRFADAFVTSLDSGA